MADLRFTCCIGILSLFISSAALAQDAPTIVDDVIRRLEDNTGITLAPPPTTQIIGSEFEDVEPGIPGIVDMGDNARLPAVPQDPPTYEEKSTVILRALDKVTARTQTYEIPVGQQFNFGALTIAIRTCRSRPPLEPADSAAFLQIVEQKAGEPMIPRFSGWMFSSSPSLSALEHPTYDIWVVGCGEAAAG
ncbi:MAG TPA: DUF2155 domain-containing protein [Alphaproteobacteria bacterium]|nr:DUF2155 domain-containing protein [Alphaproteobacteria bacterium]